MQTSQLTQSDSLTASTALSPCSSTPGGLVPAIQSLSLNKPQRRHAWFGRKAAQRPELPGAKELTQTASLRKRLMDRLTNHGLEGNSMFSDELTGATTPDGETTEVDKKAGAQGESMKTPAGASLIRDHMVRATDPDPRSRVRWERKMIIQNTRSATNPFSRESREARIARTERQSLTRSPYLPTSVKKLVHLSRQIQGKTLEEALEQMRYSKKKMAVEVAHQLRLAHDRAIVERGMGLSKSNRQGEQSAAEGEAQNKAAKIQTKDGKWLTINDPTRVYIAQSWVGRGPWRGFQKEYRARGRVNILRKPSTSKSPSASLLILCRSGISS